jgi:hypothetical protein
MSPSCMHGVKSPRADISQHPHMRFIQEPCKREGETIIDYLKTNNPVSSSRKVSRSPPSDLGDSFTYALDLHCTYSRSQIESAGEPRAVTLLRETKFSPVTSHV